MFLHFPLNAIQLKYLVIPSIWCKLFPVLSQESVVEFYPTLVYAYISLVIIGLTLTIRISDRMGIRLLSGQLRRDIQK